jgi:hypothetical protein
VSEVIFLHGQKGASPNGEFFHVHWSFLSQFICCSRNTLIAPHCNPSDPSCVDVLTTAYHTLLCSVLHTWTPKHTLSANVFVEFVQSVLNDLPSTSSTTSSNAIVFGEHLVDMMWSVDAELDEILADTKVALMTGVDQGAPNTTVSTLLSKAKKAKQSAELDKETIQVIVKKFLVRVLFLDTKHLPMKMNLGFWDCKSIFLSRTPRLVGFGYCRSHCRQGVT